MRQLADDLGIKLHLGWSAKSVSSRASILSANGDTAMMERLLDEITDTEGAYQSAVKSDRAS